MNVGPGALLLAAWLYLVGGGAALTAFFTAVLAHELGHLLAILAAGARITRLRFTAMGPLIEYSGAITTGQEAMIAAAGVSTITPIWISGLYAMPSWSNSCM